MPDKLRLKRNIQAERASEHRSRGSRRPGITATASVALERTGHR